MSNGLQTIINELRGATEDLKALNDKPCRCSEYSFPHRKGSGKCNDTNKMPEQNVPYHHSRQAIVDAGHKESDFK